MTKILFIIDAQNDFVKGPFKTNDSEAVAYRINHMLSKQPAKWDEVVATIDQHDPNQKTQTVEATSVLPHCITHSEGAALFGTIAYYVTKFITKNTFAFNAIDIWSYLEATRHGEEMEFFICGFCTDICVVSNALMLRSHFPKVNITVIENLCAGTSADRHAAALEVMKSCLIDVKASDMI